MITALLFTTCSGPSEADADILQLQLHVQLAVRVVKHRMGRDVLDHVVVLARARSLGKFRAISVGKPAF